MTWPCRNCVWSSPEPAASERRLPETLASALQVRVASLEAQLAAARLEIEATRDEAHHWHSLYLGK